MPESPLIAAGAQVEPTPAAQLHTNEFFSGMVTQANPLGPGLVPYLYQKFYSASRYDRLNGGNNVEVSPKLTLIRRPGHTVLNSAPNSGAQRFAFFRAFSGSSQNNRLLADLGSTVNDITPPSGNTALFTKSAGTQRAAFQPVGNTCYIGDGVDLKKYMLAGLAWEADTVYQLGDIVMDPSGKLQVAEQFLTANILAVQILEQSGSWYAVVTLDQGSPWSVTTDITFQNLQAYPGLNGLTYPVAFYANSNQVVVGPITPTTAYGPTPDVGMATSNIALIQGKSGGTAPTWGAGYGDVTIDGDIAWQNFGTPVYPWSPTPPSAPPVIDVNGANTQWLPQQSFLNLSMDNFYWAVLDSNNNVELLVIPPSGAAQTGPTVPLWSQIVPSATLSPGPTTTVTTGDTAVSTPSETTTQIPGGQTIDGTAVWQNCGPMLTWLADYAYYGNQCLLDSNGNLQYVSAGGGGESGGAVPTWSTTVGDTTSDGALTWTNIGPGVILLTAVRQYSYAYHTISGQISTTSPMVTLNPDGNMLGVLGAPFAELNGPTPENPDIDQIYIFATPQGTSTPLLLGKIPSPGPGIGWSFEDNFPDSVLDAELEGPQNDSNNPPPAGFMPIAFHLGLVCGFVDNVLFYSNGTTAVGNPNESFAPLNNFQLPSAIVAGWSTSIGLVVLRVDGISIMLGSNTANSPLYVVNIFDGVGLASRDAFATLGNYLFMMSSTAKVLMFNTAQFISAIQGGVSQAVPDDEIGFPIGDVLGEINPADAYVAWYEGPSKDSGLFVSDGSTGWYMMRNLTTPEQATPWSPFATISGGLTAIASIQTAPGVNSLIVGTPGGPVWKRDLSTNTDNGTAYAASADIAPIVLAQPGTTCTVQYAVTEEVKIAGATALSVSMLFDEISGSFIDIAPVSNDPPNLYPSKTALAQRFWASQNPGTQQICRFMAEQVSWPAEDFPNELLTNTVYGRLPSKSRK